MRAVMAATALLVAAVRTGMGAGVNTAPYTESFESYGEGQPIAAVAGWTASEAARAGISEDAEALAALGAYTNGGGRLPLADPHARVLTVAELVTNHVTSLDGHEVEIEFMLRPARLERMPRVNAGKQGGLSFDSNGLATVFMRDVASGSNVWRVLANSPVLGSGAWVRVTFRQDHDHGLYRVSLDGEPLVDDAGWTGAGGTQPGAWFHMPQTNGRLSTLAFSGTRSAFVDDLVVRTELPLIETRPAGNVSAVAAELRGWLSYTGLADTAVEVYWGTVDGGTNMADWAHTNVWAAPQGPGAFAHTAGAPSAALHYFRFAASNAYGRFWSPAGDTFIPGAVSVLAMDTAAAERPMDVARFRVERPGWALSGPLTVYYTLSGMATNGVDYEDRGGSVVIPTASSTADVVIVPLRDALVEGPESVQIALTAVGYLVGVPAQAHAEIADAAAVDLVWNNASGDRQWNETSTNWSGNALFWNGDRTEFVSTPVATGRVYVGQAAWVSAGQYWTNGTPVDVAPGAMAVAAGDYEFEGGTVIDGAVTVSGGRLIDRNVARNGFGGGAITLKGGEFWRYLRPDTVVRRQTLTNALVVEATSLLHGGRGTNFWTGGLELKARLNVGINQAAQHMHVFSGPLVVNQDTNIAGPRALALLDSGGRAILAGPIVDGPSPDGVARYPLLIGPGANAGELVLQGTNTYAGGTVITNFGATGAGVVVEGGSSLGLGDVRVCGGVGTLMAARLSVMASNAVQGALTVELGSMVLLQAPAAVMGSPVSVRHASGILIGATNVIADTSVLDLASDSFVAFMESGQVEQVAGLIIDGVDAGRGLFGSAEFPQHIQGDGRIRVVKPQERLDALMLWVR